ncbi:MAG: mechanosensitive ion channel family protein [Candidatus Nealsonbacteria bacterium]
MVIDWADVTIQALQNLWQGFLGFIPLLVGAIIVFVIGWFISVGVGKLISEILKRIRFNQIFEKGGWKEALEKAEIKVDASGFIGAICKWVLVIVFLLAAVEILGLVQFADFLVKVLAYLPNVIVAALIFVVAVIIADILEKVVRAAVEGVKVGYGQLVGVIVRWSIWIFAILAILIQLKIAPSLLQTLFIGFVALITIAGGIAFGLGGKDVAAELLQDLKKKLKE